MSKQVPGIHLLHNSEKPERNRTYIGQTVSEALLLGRIATCHDKEASRRAPKRKAISSGEDYD